MTQSQLRVGILVIYAVGAGAIVGGYFWQQRRSDAKWDDARGKLVDAFMPPAPDDFREVNG